MGELRAVVLAAGRGVRMGGEHPKTLLPMGEHPPLLRYILDGLKGAGVSDLFVVTGFAPGEIEAYVTEHWGEATFFRNARYASWGNFHSVRVAVDQSPGADLLIVNCDIVVAPDVYRRVIETPGELVLAVERRLGLDEEDMRVHLTERNRVSGVSKKLPRAYSHGEYCGVSLLRGAAPRAYADAATAREWRGETSGYYEDVYNDIVSSVDARAAFLNEGEYAEVDTPEDIPAAVAVISRHMLAGDSGRS